MATLDIFQRKISEAAPPERCMNEVIVYQRGFVVSGRKQGYSYLNQIGSFKEQLR